MLTRSARLPRSRARCCVIATSRIIRRSRRAATGRATCTLTIDARPAAARRRDPGRRTRSRSAGRRRPRSCSIPTPASCSRASAIRGRRRRRSTSGDRRTTPPMRCSIARGTACIHPARHSSWSPPRRRCGRTRHRATDVHLRASAGRPRRRAGSRLGAAGARRRARYASARHDRHARRAGPFVQRLLRAARGAARAGGARSTPPRWLGISLDAGRRRGAARRVRRCRRRLRPGRRGRDAAAHGAGRRGDRDGRHASRDVRWAMRRSGAGEAEAAAADRGSADARRLHARRGDRRHRAARCSNHPLADRRQDRHRGSRPARRRTPGSSASRRTGRRRGASPLRSSSRTPAMAARARRPVAGEIVTAAAAAGLAQ